MVDVIATVKMVSGGTGAVPGSGATRLAELSDVGTAGVTAGFALVADGTNYQGRPLAKADIGDLNAHEVGGGDIPISDGGTGASTIAVARSNLGLSIGSDVQAWSATLDAITAAFTVADETKLDNITITQPVDLDAIETRVNALDAAVILQGVWDASSGVFPGGGTAQAGDSYIVDTTGTHDGISFAANDRIIAIVDNASTATYVANWHKADYTDEVLSVSGKTGAVILAAADIASGVFADARISESSVTQHQAALSIAKSQVSGLLESLTIAIGDETTDATTGIAKVTFRMPYAFTLTDIRASCSVAPAGSAAIIDVNEGGVSIMTTDKLSIDAGGMTTETATTVPALTDTALADDEAITIDIDQVGSSTAGAGYKVTLIGNQS